MWFSVQVFLSVTESIFVIASCFDFIICSCVYELVFLTEECLLLCIDVEWRIEQCVRFSKGREGWLCAAIYVAVL
jgi:hypothetical protein